MGYGAIFERSVSGSSFGMGGHEFIVRESDFVLYYNQPQRYRELIKLEYSELQKRNSELEVSVFFGGETTPLMLS